MNLKASQDCYKIYADKKKNFQEFQVGYHMYVRMKPKMSNFHSGGCAKVSPYFCGPFQILA